jgi:hypothetical protein
MKKRMAIFTSACCTGWAYSYNADDRLQGMIRKHAERFNSQESWQKRNCDGSVELYDSVEQAIEKLTDRFEAEDVEQIKTEKQLFDFFRQDGDGDFLDAAWVVHMLLSDPLSEEWMPQNH